MSFLARYYVRCMKLAIESQVKLIIRSRLSTPNSSKDKPGAKASLRNRTKTAIVIETRKAIGIEGVGPI